MLMDHPVAELAARTPTATLPRLRTASAERRSADAISAPRKPRAPLARLTEGAAGCADTHSVDGARLLAFSANLSATRSQILLERDFLDIDAASGVDFSVARMVGLCSDLLEGGGSISKRERRQP